MSISTKFDWLSGLAGWRAWLACFASGALMTQAFAPFGVWWLIFLTLPVFYLVLEASPTRHAATLRGFFFGYGYFMAGTYWIAFSMLVDVAKFGWLMPISILGLSAVFAVCFAAFGLAFHWLKCGDRLRDLARFSVLWTVMEYGRSIGIFGFPWNLAGYVAGNSLALMQLASVIGTFGLSFFVVRIGLAPVLLHERESRLRRRLTVAVPVLAIALGFAFGTARLHRPVAMTATQLRLVQPSVPQTLKADPRAAGEVMGRLTALTQAPSVTAPDAIIWPETAMPFTLWPDSSVPREMMQSLHTNAPLITGVVTAQGSDRGHDLRVWNSVVALAPQGAVDARYSKYQLVPFGEFVPLRALLPLDKITPGDLDFSRGEGPQTVRVPGLPPFSPLVCYEVIFPWIAVDARDRPDWIVNVTNDGWYGRSPGPYQHFAMARMRAVEQGLPLVRAANNGISAVIDPYGRVMAALPLDAQSVLDAALPAPLAPTGYARHRELAALIILASAWCATFLPIKRRIG